MSEDKDMHDVQPWIDAMADAMKEVATTTLGYAGCTVLGPRTDSGALSGGYVALVGDKCSVQVAVASEPSMCQSIAARLFEMPEDEADSLPDGDVADAVGELVNIVGGLVKTRMAKLDGSLQLGLPFVIEGVIESTKRLKSEYVEADLGGVKVVLVVIIDTMHAVEAAA